jgi:hypothetical protein
MLVIVISRVLMFLISRKKPIHFGEYALWIIAEIFSMALAYAIIQRFLLHGQKDFMTILHNSVRITAFIILLPYVIFWLYLSFKDKYVLLEKLRTNHSGPDENSYKTTGGNWSMIQFRDEKGILRFSIKGEDLLYL